MKMKSEYKLIFWGLVFEYALFQPLWSMYVSDKLSYQDINLFGSIALISIASLVFLFVIFKLEDNIIKRMLMYSLLTLLVFSITGYFIDQNMTFKVEPVGLDTYERVFKGFWLKDQFTNDYSECAKLNLNFYNCFEGSDQNPWVFTDFFKYIQYIITTIILSLLISISYMIFRLYKIRNNSSTD